MVNNFVKSFIIWKFAPFWLTYKLTFKSHYLVIPIQDKVILVQTIRTLKSPTTEIKGRLFRHGLKNNTKYSWFFPLKWVGGVSIGSIFRFRKKMFLPQVYSFLFFLPGGWVATELSWIFWNHAIAYLLSVRANKINLS